MKCQFQVIVFIINLLYRYVVTTCRFAFRDAWTGAKVMKFFLFAWNFFRREISGFLAAIFVAATLAALAGCGSGSTATTPGSPPTAGGNTITLSSSSPTMTSSGGSVVLTATVLAPSGQIVVGQALTFSKAAAETVSFGAPSGAVTDATGKVTITLNVGTDPTNRTVTITATAGSATKQIPIQITGSTVTMNPSGTNLPDDGTSPLTLTVTAKDSAGVVVANTPITFSKAGAGNLTLAPTSGTTNALGQLTVTITGVTAGSVTVTAMALGATASTIFTVSASAATFSIDQTTNGAVVTVNPTLVTMRIGDMLMVRANAPAPAANVTFATTLGTWTVSGTTTQTVAVAGGKATAILQTTQAGLANVQAFDPLVPASSDTLAVSMTAVTPAIITLQASPGVVAKNVGTTSGISTLIATVTDAVGQPVGNAPVAFSIVNPTGGGESVTPVVAYTATVAGGGLGLGQVSATFTAGSLSSSQAGVSIRATVLGVANVATESLGPPPVNAFPSGPDAAIIISGTAASIAFGQATVLQEANNATNYVLAMSVLVADSNGSPAPAGTVVNLSTWPIAWSTGGGCAIDADTATTGTFRNEDVNENLILDAGEDGARNYYSGLLAPAVGTSDGLLTPTSSAAGIVPATVTTDLTGVATFNLTYGKSSALWIVTRLRARTVVQGTAAVSELQFRLAPLSADVTPTCRLPNSPYIF